jgi:hypothetical protein
VFQNEDMSKVFVFLLRLVLLLAGLLFAASLVVVALLLLALWGLRYLWARLTGQPVLPFVMRVDPRGSFNRMYRAGRATSAGQSGQSTAGARDSLADVTDVEPKHPGV